MKRYFSFLLFAILAVSFAAPAAHGVTPAKQRATCATLKTAFPFGVASTDAAAASAAATTMRVHRIDLAAHLFAGSVLAFPLENRVFVCGSLCCSRRHRFP